MGYNASGKQVTRFIRAECFPEEVSALIMPNRILMKIAISGKGGVGKRLLAAILPKIFAESGYSVLAIDANPDANLAATPGFPHPKKIVPIFEMKDPSSLPGCEIPGFIPYDSAIVDADFANIPIVDASEQIINAVRNI
jgi:CO dehydrogenase nickel-insertion accessory protein CooC1